MKRNPGIHILVAVPLFTFLLIAYNLIVFSYSENPQHLLDSVVFTVKLMSGSFFLLKVSDLLLVLGVIALYFEIFKATSNSTASIVDHILSTLIFVIFLVEFIVVPAAGNSTFLVMTLMAFLDVIAGFTVSIVSARRDLVVGR